MVPNDRGGRVVSLGNPFVADRNPESGKTGNHVFTEIFRKETLKPENRKTRKPEM